jgi:hypothetical protein
VYGERYVSDCHGARADDCDDDNADASEWHGHDRYICVGNPN